MEQKKEENPGQFLSSKPAALNQGIRPDTLKQGNISLILSSYDDIFSGFDPRDYSEKALSTDFLTECKNAARDKAEDGIGLEMRLLVPKNKRSFTSEMKIKKRLKNHFQKHYHEKLKEQKRIKKEGILWFIMGACLIFISTLIYEYKGYIYRLLFVLSEPAGWFTLWNGLEKVFIRTKEKQPEYDFYRKMANVRIYFHSY